MFLINFEKEGGQDQPTDPILQDHSILILSYNLVSGCETGYIA